MDKILYDKYEVIIIETLIKNRIFKYLTQNLNLYQMEKVCAENKKMPIYKLFLYLH